MREPEYNCAEIDDLVEAMVDGDLDRDEKAAFSAHLEGCSACRKQYDEALRLVSELPEMLADTSEETRERAISASIRAFNRIEKQTHMPDKGRIIPSRNKWIRRTVLTGGWVGAALVMIRASSLARWTREPDLSTITDGSLVSLGAAYFSTTPTFFVVGLVLTAAAIFVSLRIALMEE